MVGAGANYQKVQVGKLHKRGSVVGSSLNVLSLGE